LGYESLKSASRETHSETFENIRLGEQKVAIDRKMTRSTAQTTQLKLNPPNVLKRLMAPT
jgi:hypothetical protein